VIVELMRFSSQRTIKLHKIPGWATFRF
jgi:hypothetical protein